MFKVIVDFFKVIEDFHDVQRIVCDNTIDTEWFVIKPGEYKL